MENEPIPVLHLETCHVNDVKLKNIHIESTRVTIFEEEVFWKTQGVVGCLLPLQE